MGARSRKIQCIGLNVHGRDDHLFISKENGVFQGFKLDILKFFHFYESGKCHDGRKSIQFTIVEWITSFSLRIDSVRMVKDRIKFG